MKALLLSLSVQIFFVVFAEDAATNGNEQQDLVFEELKYLSQQEANQKIKMAHIQKEIDSLTSRMEELLKSDFLTVHEKNEIFHKLKNEFDKLEQSQFENE
ncbi:MAG: hypothetical protein H6622_04880 [Halobacteriovoraceae bacterium]|nr:hypothetical protein [Halobacteriovoraceae bacterium]